MNAPADTKLVNVIYIRTTAAALWDALTRPEFTRQYYVGMEIKADLRPGGRFDYYHRFEEHRRHGTGLEGVVIEVVPHQRLVHTFEPKFISDLPSRVCYEIEQVGPVCKLTVTHDEFPAGGPTLEVVREGWPPILSSLKSLLETGAALTFPRHA